MLKRAGAERIFVDFPPGDFHLIEPGLVTADIVLPKPNTFAGPAPKLTSASAIGRSVPPGSRV